MRIVPPDQLGINGLPLFDHSRMRQRRMLSPAARRIADRFDLQLATGDILAELAGFTARDRR
jgi:hypothetical protein